VIVPEPSMKESLADLTAVIVPYNAPMLQRATLPRQLRVCSEARG